MRLVLAVGVACLFVGVTFILNDLIAHWWGQTAGVGTSSTRIPLEGLALVVIGVVLAMVGDRLSKRARQASSDAPRAKPEKVVLYEHGPDRPY